MSDLRYLSRMVHQQFWLFGYDIRRSQGNLLLEMGFERTRHPGGEKGPSTRYHRVLTDGSIVTLWGFGVCWSSPTLGSIYVPRLKPRPWYLARDVYLPDAWDPQIIHQFHAPETPAEIDATAILAHDLAQWVTAYELEVVHLCGADYRQEAIDAWRDPVGHAESLPRYWQRCLISTLRGEAMLAAR